MTWPLLMGWFLANPLEDVQLILEANTTQLDAGALQKAAIQGMLEHADTLNGHSGSRVMTTKEKSIAWLMGRRTGYGLRVQSVWKRSSD